MFAVRIATVDEPSKYLSMHVYTCIYIYTICFVVFFHYHHYHIIYFVITIIFIHAFNYVPTCVCVYVYTSVYIYIYMYVHMEYYIASIGILNLNPISTTHQFLLNKLQWNSIQNAIPFSMLHPSRCFLHGIHFLTPDWATSKLFVVAPETAGNAGVLRSPRASNAVNS